MKKILPLFAAVVMTLAASAQGTIPNGTFASWTGTAGSGLEKCTSWKLSNDTINTNGFFASTGNVYENNSNGTFFHTSPSIKLQSKKYSLTSTTSLKAPAVAVSGPYSKIVINPLTNAFTLYGGYPFTDRPDSLKGFVGYLAGAGTDAAKISVVLSKWNSASNKRDTIAMSSRILTTTISPMTAFWDTLVYFSATNPDTCSIVLLSSTSFPAIDTTSVLYVDDLSFAGIDNTQFPSPSAVSEVAHESFTLYPNPAGNAFTLRTNSVNGARLQLYNLLGQRMKQVVLNGHEQRIDASDLENGIYLYQILNPEGVPVTTGRIIIQK